MRTSILKAIAVTSALVAFASAPVLAQTDRGEKSDGTTNKAKEMPKSGAMSSGSMSSGSMAKPSGSMASGMKKDNMGKDNSGSAKGDSGAGQMSNGEVGSGRTTDSKSKS